TWEQAARRAGLRFGVSNHASHAWHWWQTAYGYDPEGPRRGERYDAFRLRKEHGRGKWWEGLDPQELYTGASFAPPDGIASNQSMADWHDAHDGRWMEFAPVQNSGFAGKWLLRQKELVEKYRPDMVYLDDYGLPFGPAGIEALAHYYNQAVGWHGSADVVMTAKVLSPYQRRGLVEDIERGFSDRLRDEPWQTCTCIGDWHYNRARFDSRSYVPAEQIIQRLVDTVSKNGSLLLSIPMRGDGTIDSEEENILDGIEGWMRVNGDAAIHGSRPWRIFGEGPTSLAGGMMSESAGSQFTARDIRFLTKDRALYAAFLKWPGQAAPISALGLRALAGAKVERATLLEGGGVPFQQRDDALVLTLPQARRGSYVPVVKLEGRGLV
ncbi:MAG: alpha-L-fucosidase, partial [Novosphingobium sp.]